MSEEDIIDEIIQSGENQTVDFKSLGILSNPFKLACLMTAFANTNGGRILIGIKDDGSFEGIREDKSHETHIMNIARDVSNPPLTPTFQVIHKPGGDIYVIKILRYRTVPFAARSKDGNVYYIRVGTSVRPASPNEISLLFEGSRHHQVEKKPQLEMQLLHKDENSSKELTVTPTIFKKIPIMKDPALYPGEYQAHQQLKRFVDISRGINLFTESTPSEDLVPIGIELANVGEIPANGIRIFITFPPECEIASHYDVVGGIGSLMRPQNNNIGGIFVNDETEAQAFVKQLGNDLVANRFTPVFVLFPPEEATYIINARVIQQGYPPTDFEFTIHVKPTIKEIEEIVWTK